MKFRTEIQIPKSDFTISHSSKIMAMGSCFVENIGQKLDNLRFDIDINPFGIIFNPYSIAKIIKNAINNELNYNTNFVERHQQLYCYDFHSKFNATSTNEFLDNIKSTNKKTNQSLLMSDALMLTFGTAWIYKHKTSNQIVANCHKIPQSEFEKSMLDLEELKSIYFHLFTDFFEKNSSLKIILTVSPVRHLKDGFVENNQSKSVLLLLCQYLSNSFPKQVFYFPSYEIVMDDLRNYRFYNSDLIHPNQQAVDYIFEKFSATFFEDNTLNILPKLIKLNQLKAHRFLNASDADKLNHQTKIDDLENELNLPTTR